jgi:molybdopterin-guanine dinucleotide biosynthesis protein A
VTVAGIVLAGGEGRRFGGDKLAADLDGRPLLAHALDAVAPVVDIIVVALGATGREPAVVSAAGPRLVVVRDPGPGGGPLVALENALAAAAAEHATAAVVVGGDMPWLDARVLRAILATLDDPTVQVGLAIVDGRRRPLPMALRVGPALVTATERLAAGRRSLAALFDVLTLAELGEPEWRLLDPDGASFRDVDRPEDLPPMPQHRSDR